MITTKDRFVKKCNLVDNGCWIWTGALHHTGYGKFLYQGKLKSAHRVSYMLFKGHIPEGMQVNHRCDNKSCVNPEHLHLGNNASNTKDAFSRGLISHVGSLNTRAKLDESRVADIKKMLRDEQKHWLIASIFQVSKDTIWNIKSGRSWKHVTI